MTAWDFLKDLNKVCFFMSKERPGRATNSELKRWCQNKALCINGIRPKFDAEIEFPITSMYLFPKRKVTLM